MGQVPARVAGKTAFWAVLGPFNFLLGTLEDAGILLVFIYVLVCVA